MLSFVKNCSEAFAQVDQLGSVTAAESERMEAQIVDTEAQPPLHPPPSDSSVVSTTAGVASRKRKRSLRRSSSKSEPDRLSQSLVDDRGNEPTPQTSKSSKRWRMDCVLITTLPPVLRKKTAPKPSENEDIRPRTKGKKRGRGKQRMTPSSSKASLPSGAQPPPTLSRSHSVSSLRPPLFQPVSSDPIQTTLC